MSDFVVPLSNADFPPCMNRGGNTDFPCMLSGNHACDHRDSMGNTWPRTCGDLPDVPPDSWRHGACNLQANHNGTDHVNDACHTWASQTQPEPVQGIGGLRLLPWTDADGKPAYTPNDNPHGVVAQMADDVERSQLKFASDMHEMARQVLAVEQPLEPTQARYLLAQLSNALVNVVRVAESRGLRLPKDEADDE
ncbi:hypothetical protein [Streptomyces sp. NPDC088733]|uniref:hypothetical protein n=1 Tax=Streptomyces sp. NPDC088733 TaxID=3365880 RepID=UPI003803F34D